MRDICKWHVEEFAYLVAKLKSVPEGDGSVFDHTTLIYTHEHAEANPHKNSGLAMIVAGGSSKLARGQPHPHHRYGRRHLPDGRRRSAGCRNREVPDRQQEDRRTARVVRRAIPGSAAVGVSFGIRSRHRRACPRVAADGAGRGAGRGRGGVGRVQRGRDRILVHRQDEGPILPHRQLLEARQSGLRLRRDACPTRRRCCRAKAVASATSKSRASGTSRASICARTSARPSSRRSDSGEGNRAADNRQRQLREASPPRCGVRGQSSPAASSQ